jgi:hypothetical protein
VNCDLGANAYVCSIQSRMVPVVVKYLDVRTLALIPEGIVGENGYQFVVIPQNREVLQWALVVKRHTRYYCTGLFPQILD